VETSNCWPDDDVSQAGASDWRREVRLRALARTSAPFERHAKLALLVMLVHIGVAMLLWRAHVERRASDERAVVVELLSNPNIPSAPPPAPSSAAFVPKRSRQPSTNRAVPSDTEVSTPTESVPPQLQLFDRNGSVRLPSWQPFTTPLDAGLARGRELLARGHNILGCVHDPLDRFTPEEAANAAGASARMAHLVMGNPLDPLNDVGASFEVDGAIQAAADKRAREMRACDGF
jgi:hypothetical protein